MKALLRNPDFYQFFQVAGGFFSARLRAIDRYLTVNRGQRLIDIGCGPGHISSKLPQGIIYDGFDLDEAYINFANARFGEKGKFHCRVFDEAAAAEFGPADIVMMNGVLHHMDDEMVQKTAETVSKALKPGGIFFALDGVYTPDQNAVAKWLLQHDRGRFVRTESGYRALLEKRFVRCEFHVHNDLTRVPYDLIISKCSRAG
jgi:2-polyprenyl-3-methyl-5-hydroxy-6-metoxy-1,4-benzoquinol methylase